MTIKNRLQQITNSIKTPLTPEIANAKRVNLCKGVLDRNRTDFLRAEAVTGFIV